MATATETRTAAVEESNDRPHPRDRAGHHHRRRRRRRQARRPGRARDRRRRCHGHDVPPPPRPRQARPGSPSTQGVNVEVGKKEAAIDVVIIVRYGYAIPTLAQEVRENVITRVENRHRPHREGSQHRSRRHALRRRQAHRIPRRSDSAPTEPSTPSPTAMTITWYRTADPPRRVRRVRHRRVRRRAVVESQLRLEASSSVPTRSHADRPLPLATERGQTILIAVAVSSSGDWCCSSPGSLPGDEHTTTTPSASGTATATSHRPHHPRGQHRTSPRTPRPTCRRHRQRHPTRRRRPPTRHPRHLRHGHRRGTHRALVTDVLNERNLPCRLRKVDVVDVRKLKTRHRVRR